MRPKLVAAATAAAGLALAWTGSEAAELQDFQVNTVDELATLCGVDPTDELYVDAIQFCYGYITGAVQFHNAMVRAGTIKRPIACPPPDATRAEFAQYFSTWARTKATSAQLAEPSLEGAARAAAEKYPCPR